MLDVTTLIADAGNADSRRAARLALSAVDDRAPVVVWNCTRRCNLACRHCYTDSTLKGSPELPTREAAAMLADLATFGCPALVISGGEPLLRPDLFELIGEARRLGLAVVLSTNGTTVTRAVANRLAGLDLRRVVVSLDGIGVAHNAFRGRRVAFSHAVRGIRFLRRAGVSVGVQTTVAHSTLPSLSGVLALAEAEGVERICFRHLVPAGRGWTRPPIAAQTVRAALERLFTWTERAVERGTAARIVTAGNYADGPAMVLWLLNRDRDLDRADRVRRALDRQGGARGGAGRGLAAVDWEGVIRPDPSWGGPGLGSVRERALSVIWTDPPPRLRALRERPERLTGRCRSCRFLAMCGGGLAARALAAGDLWGPDPSCHLNRDEIGLAA